MKTGTLELAAMNCHHRFYELEDFFRVQNKMDINL